MARVFTFSRGVVLDRTWPFVIDLVIGGIGLACFYGVLTVAHNWFGAPQPAVEIHMVPRALPLYALFSMVRIGIAYVISLVAAIAYGYIAAYNKRLEAFMIAALDILQSIPVLSFLPPVTLAMAMLIPGRQLGIEMGAILLIVTSQVWNLAFSFYTSIKSIPRELREASDVYRLGAWQRFWQLEMPYSAIGLVWNSMVSVAQGWFALIVCEMFTLGKRDVRLPGLGSYLQTAADNDDKTAMLWGIAVQILIIVATDIFIWRPAIAWSDRFKFEQVDSGRPPESRVLAMVQQSRALNVLFDKTWSRWWSRMNTVMIGRHLAQPREQRPVKHGVQYVLAAVVITVGACVSLYAAFRALGLLRQVHEYQLGILLEGAGATFLRVNAALLISALWTIPVGVAIGLNRKLAHYAQPLAQIAASVPAPALFPILLLGLIRLGGGIGIGSVLLMVLGAQWYILFNVIAGAMSIPSDLKEVATSFRFSRWQRWKTVILPGIFPFLITGVLTASGGAWNASIFAEAFRFKGQLLTTTGLGAQIDHATVQANFPMLLMATILMSLMVVTMNRLVWRRMYRLAETRYKLES
jgi:NitT/TauT family transport system permease protein